MDHDRKSNTQKKKPLSTAQRRGMETYQLSEQDVNAPHFGTHTLRGIDELQNGQRTNSVQEAYAMVRGLKNYQVKGMVTYGFSREQMQRESFESHTVRGIQELISQRRANSAQAAFEMVRGLSKNSTIGVVDFGLSRDQVNVQDFDWLHFDRIKKLVKNGLSENYRAAYKLLQGLNDGQIRGVGDLGLSRDQVTAPNFGSHTVSGINRLQEQNRTVQEAYEVVRELDYDQIHGIVDFGLSRDQVRAPNFGSQTVEGIHRLRQRQNMNTQVAYQLVRELDRNQINGVVGLRLRRDQVMIPNFGRHTLEGIKHFLQQNRTVQDAYQLVRELDGVQVRGVTMGLSREQVQTVNFGRHTVEGIQDQQRQARIRRDRNFTYEEAFRRIGGLDAPQVTGITGYGLNRRQVQAPNFGEHTFEGILQLRRQRRANDDHAAFGILEGLDAFRTRAITEYILDRQQVIAPTFNRINFEVMEQLRTANPGAQGQHLYEVARNMLEFQARALTVNRLSPEQLGIGRNGNEFVLNGQEVEGISGSVVDAHSHLMTVEGLSHEDALGAARVLDSTQTIGMIEFGLSLEQVQSSYFVHREEVLGALSEALQQLNVNEFPIEERHRQLIRETFDGMRSGVASMPVRVPGPDDSETDEERALGQGKPVKAPHEGQLEDDRKPAAKEDFGKKKAAPTSSSGEDRKPMAKETPQQTKAVGSQGENTQQEGIQTSGEGVTWPWDGLNIFGGLELSSGDTDRQEARSSEETPDQVAAVASIQDLARRPARQGNSTKRSGQKKEGPNKKKSKKPTP